MGIMLALACMMFVGCSLISPSSKSAGGAFPIKIINNEMANNCKFLGVASGNVYGLHQTASENISDAQLKAAEEALNLGANAAIIVRTEVYNPGNIATVDMDAFKCPE
jgi:hypothetical protein